MNIKKKNIYKKKIIMKNKHIKLFKELKKIGSKHYEEQQIFENEKLERLKRETPLLIKYLDMLNDPNSVLKYTKKGDQAIILKNGDELRVETIDWDQGDEFYLVINGRRIPGSYSDDIEVFYTIELKDLINRVIEIVNIKREHRKNKNNWKDW